MHACAHPCVPRARMCMGACTYACAGTCVHTQAMHACTCIRAGDAAKSDSPRSVLGGYTAVEAHPVRYACTSIGAFMSSCVCIVYTAVEAHPVRYACTSIGAFMSSCVCIVYTAVEAHPVRQVATTNRRYVAQITQPHSHTATQPHSHTATQPHTQRDTHRYTQIHTHEHTHTCTRTRTHARMHARTHTHTYAHTHTHIHTRTGASQLPRSTTTHPSTCLTHTCLHIHICVPGASHCQGRRRHIPQPASHTHAYIYIYACQVRHIAKVDDDAFLNLPHTHMHIHTYTHARCVTLPRSMTIHSSTCLCFSGT